MIKPMLLSDLGTRCNGELVGSDVQFASVSTDSRQLIAGELFVALSGENFDGNRFAESAAQNDACGVVVSKQVDVTIAQLVTADTSKALGEIAAHCRAQFTNPVVAITGSSGKTTARRMLSAIMETQGSVCSNFANNNNEIGVPLTLLRLEQTHRCAVIEMGARHIGDIAYLGEFVKPDIAILLNAGTAHIGEFGGYENIVQAKGEIYGSLREQGTAIVNIDDPASDQWIASLNAAQIFTYGLHSESGADVTAAEIQLGAKQVEFKLHYQGDRVDILLNAMGQHNVSNALASAAAALSMGVSLSQIAKGLKNYRSESGRAHFLQLSETVSVIDDSYNANPASVKAALDALELQSGYKVAVIGEMGELGGESETLHREIAKYCENKHIDEFWFIGSHANAMAKVVGSKASVFTENKAIADSIRTLKKGEVCVLLKASRFMALEKVIAHYEEKAS